MNGDYDGLWCIIYISSTIKDLSKGDVERYLTESRIARKEVGISGLAIMAQSNVLVLQEGKKGIVKDEFELGRRHPAHHSIIKLYDGPLEDRLFEDYPLAFKVIGFPDFKALDDFQKEENKEYFSEVLSLENQIVKIIKDFIKNNQ